MAKFSTSVASAVIAGIILAVGAYLVNDYTNKLNALNQKVSTRITELENIETRVGEALYKLPQNIQTEIKSTLLQGTELPSTGGNTRSGTCEDGSYLIGMRFQIDPGGPHGIVSNVFPICRSFGLGTE